MRQAATAERAHKHVHEEGHGHGHKHDHGDHVHEVTTALSHACTTALVYPIIYGRCRTGLG